MIDYINIENELCEVINSDNYNAKPLPDNESEFTKNFAIPQVYLAYVGSDYAPCETLSVISQSETCNFDIYFRVNTRRGEKGLIQVVREVSDKLLGYKIGFSKIQFTKQGFIDGAQNSFNYVLSFNFNSQVFENQPEQLSSTFKKIDHVQN